MNFMLVKVRSTVAVVTGSTIRMAASLARLGKDDNYSAEQRELAAKSSSGSYAARA